MRKNPSRDPGPKPVFSIKTASYGKIVTKSHKAQEVLAEPKILDVIIATHNSIGHPGQDATAKNVSQSYYGVSRKEVIFLVKLCEICHRKAHSKSKGPLVPIISTKLFERVQIGLIDMRSTPDITTNVIFK